MIKIECQVEVFLNFSLIFTPYLPPYREAKCAFIWEPHKYPAVISPSRAHKTFSREVYESELMESEVHLKGLSLFGRVGPWH